MIDKRKGARRISEIPPEILQQLNKGEFETANLVECLAIDFAALLKNCFPKINKNSLKKIEGGWVGRCKISAEVLFENFGEKFFDEVKNHRSDMIRSIACALLKLSFQLNLEQKIKKILPLADDHHMGVREAAWLFLRDDITEDVNKSIKLLSPLTKSKRENIRRFASEITRPRGVWCKHINELKKNPELGLSILEPLKNENHRYPANSVANWLNDVSKNNPEFVISLTEKWLKQSPTKETNYICKRALRTINSKR